MEIENSMLYKKNVEIHRNLWKPYTIALIVSFMVIVIEKI